MKSNLLLLIRSLVLGTTFLISSLNAVSQNVNIPDANFKKRLLRNELINTNADREIQITEAAAFTGGIDVSYQNISDLIGIEAFTALTSLYCSNNQLTSLDVSANTALTQLWCHRNQLNSLDVSANTALTELYCSDNQLTSLDVTANTALTVLVCSGNQLTSLDVSANTAFISLFCSSNQLTSLDVSANTALISLFCSSNQLTSLDVSANTALTQLGCSNNQLTSLNVQNANNTELRSFRAYDNPNLSCIQVDNVVWSTANWTAPYKINATARFSVACTAK